MDSIEFDGANNSKFLLNFTDKAERALKALATELGFATPEALLYIVDYGWRQAHSDPVAGRAKKFREEGRTEADIEAALEAIQRERNAAILAGTVGSRSSGPRLKPLDKLAYEEGVKALERAYAKASRKWPSGQGAADEIRQGVALIWEKYPKVREAHYAEAERQMANLNAYGEMDLVI